MNVSPPSRNALLFGFTMALLTLFIVILAIEYEGIIHPGSEYSESVSLFRRVTRMDGYNYATISNSGYRYKSNLPSNVAFFPAYPLIAKMTASLLNIPIETALVILSNLFFILLCLVFVVIYSRSDLAGQWGCVLLVLMPSGFFFRMPYSESMFCMLIVIVLLGMQRRWPIWSIAILAGLASATRPVGIALSVTVWWYVLSTNRKPNSISSTQPPYDNSSRLLRLLWVIPLSCWGLLAYATYLWWNFGNPLAFAQTQDNWTYLAPSDYSLWKKAWSLVTLEPIWNIYNPNSRRYWLNADNVDNPFFSLMFWNPIFYLFTWFLVLLGWRKRWLRDYELVLSLGLLLIPYFTRAYEMSMGSHARFATVVIPQYFVLGRLVAMMPPPIAGCLCALMGVVLGFWTTLFVAGYNFF